MDIIFLEFLLPYQISFSIKVKRSAVISNKHGICKGFGSYINFCLHLPTPNFLMPLK